MNANDHKHEKGRYDLFLNSDDIQQLTVESLWMIQEIARKLSNEIDIELTQRERESRKLA